MKISQPSDNPVVTSSHAATLAAKNGPAAVALAKTSATKGAQVAGVAVTVSSLARSLDADSSAEVDMDKVNAVKQSISDGTFVVNPGAIADKLLSNAQEMLQRSRI